MEDLARRRTLKTAVLKAIAVILFAEGVPPALRDVAAALGCSPATVTSRVAELVSAGLLTRVGAEGVRSNRHWVPSGSGWELLRESGDVEFCAACKRPHLRSAA